MRGNLLPLGLSLGPALAVSAVMPLVGGLSAAAPRVLVAFVQA